jgi:hypothetical protein
MFRLVNTEPSSGLTTLYIVCPVKLLKNTMVVNVGLNVVNILHPSFIIKQNDFSVAKFASFIR